MFEELTGSAVQSAQRLLGCELEHTLDGQTIRVRIVETEAYDQNDPASHTFKGKTHRNSVMFGPAGYLYVYFIYGMHHCGNVVTGKDGFGQGALIRAVEPIEGINIIEKNRHGHSGVNLTNGPSKWCQALHITREYNGHDLKLPPIKLVLKPPLKKHEIITTSRIGISQATEVPWRFFILDNPYVSQPNK